MAGDSNPERRRGPGRPFQPGQSGNPSGMPKAVADFRRKCRELSDEAVETLRACLKHDDGRVQVAAAKEILDRAWGKAAQPITGEDGKPVVDLGIVDALRKLSE